MSAPRETPPVERFLPGQILARRYRVVERIGQGAMGEVYRAHDLKLGEPVALKFLPPGLVDDPGRLEDLFAEVRLARQITHPNVCRVHDVVEADGMHFLSMEFVDGEDLASLLRRIGRLPADKAVDVAREICAGLAAIHDRGVLHRDLKPANVMIDGRGHARITDFGLAQLQGVAGDSETIAGTPAYMAPESLEGGAPTVRTDLYSLGLVLYELFTGRRPFEAPTFAEMIRLRRETVPESPASHVRDLDPAVGNVTLRCLDRDPGRRPASAVAVAAALPGGDLLAAMVAAGRTPSPELVAATRTGAEGLRPAVAWSCLSALAIGLLVVTAVAPGTRLVPALTMPDPPEAMAGRARALLDDLGLATGAGDRTHGYDLDESVIERVIVEDRSRSRWRRIAEVRPPVVSFWYRESPTDLVPVAPAWRVTSTDPPLTEGTVVVSLDLLGRLRRLEAPRGPGAPPAEPGPPDMTPLFRAAGLDTADFREVAAAPLAGGAPRRRFSGHERGNRERPLQVELASLHGRPVFFAVREVPAPPGGAAPADPSGRITNAMHRFVRPALFLATLLLGAWLARRNLRDGHGDPRRALRVASVMMTLRIGGWALGTHYTPGSLTEQLMSAIAWGLYDFAYGWVSYTAIEPHLRRLWPRMLTTWVRLLDGRHGDPSVGRDLLVGCLAGVAIALAVAGHQAAPAWFGAPPGRPDNVGFVEDQLASLLGLRHQLAGILVLVRSNLVLLMGFVVILVLSRIALRHAGAAFVVAWLIFVPLALPRGEFPVLNVALAAFSMLILAVVLLRFGLLAAGTALIAHAVLESSPLAMGLSAWPVGRTVLALALVMGVGLYGFAHSLRGRAAPRVPAWENPCSEPSAPRSSC